MGKSCRERLLHSPLFRLCRGPGCPEPAPVWGGQVCYWRVIYAPKERDCVQQQPKGTPSWSSSIPSSGGAAVHFSLRSLRYRSKHTSWVKNELMLGAAEHGTKGSKALLVALTAASHPCVPAWALWQCSMFFTNLVFLSNARPDLVCATACSCWGVRSSPIHPPTFLVLGSHLMSAHTAELTAHVQGHTKGQGKTEHLKRTKKQWN